MNCRRLTETAQIDCLAPGIGECIGVITEVEGCPFYLDEFACWNSITVKSENLVRVNLEMVSRQNNSIFLRFCKRVQVPTENKH